jgi:pyruvate/2-oxoglutarate dehydrogenase complex dihydrolipoamide acyltransferase (E2) component
MPKLGHLLEEATVFAWRRSEGEAVTKGEVLVEVETEKAVIEVEADVSGTLVRILVPEGETVEVGTPLAVIAPAGEAAGDG